MNEILDKWKYRDELKQALLPIELDERITRCLLELGIPANIKGYHYIKEAINTVIEIPEIINRITKELYPAIAKKVDSKPFRVERAIRHAIAISHLKGNIEFIDTVFSHTLSQEKGTLANGQFISILAEFVDMEG